MDGHHSDVTIRRAYIDVNNLFRNYLWLLCSSLTCASHARTPDWGQKENWEASAITSMSSVTEIACKPELALFQAYLPLLGVSVPAVCEFLEVSRKHFVPVLGPS